MKKICFLISIIFIICALSGCAKDGLSAYEIAVENGFVGDEEAWLDSLQGEKGDKGDKGDEGDRGLTGWEGEDGKDAPYIKKSYVNDELHLIIEMSDGTIIDAGYVGVDISNGSGEPVLSESEACITPGNPYIIGCNLVGIAWESSDPDVLRVTDGGLILGIAEGEATVTATSLTGEKSTCKVTVASYEYSLKADGTVRIDGYTGYQTVLNIPSAINGKPVTEINRWAFMLNESITEVNLSDSVVKIGDGTFSACSNIKKITLGNSLTHIGNAAFSGCESLLEIKLPESLTHIGESAFNMCESLVEVAIPSGITKLNGSTFNYCSGLEKIDFGNVETLGAFEFYGCTSLTSVTLPETVSKIGDEAFAKCINLKSFVWENENAEFGLDVFTGSYYLPGFDISFTDVDKKMYATLAYSVRSTPSSADETNVVSSLSVGDSVKVTGIYYENEADRTGWARIIHQNAVRYVRIFCLSDTPPTTQGE